MSLRVLTAGALTTVQDLGRPGLAHLGVSPSGAADRAALALGNRLMGNPVTAAGLEITLGGLRVRADGPHLICLTGAAAAVLVDGQPRGTGAVVAVAAGSIVEVAAPVRGVRSYLAVRGGIAVAPVLGSRSYDVLSGLGPPPLRPGDVVPVGPPTERLPDIDQAPVAALAAGEVAVGARLGPRADWFVRPAALFERTWTMSPDSDRVGVRLVGSALERARWDELPSEGLIRGAVQVPPSGQPVVLLADHPVTGGYPVIAVVDDPDTDVLAQLAPGQAVRLRART